MTFIVLSRPRNLLGNRPWRVALASGSFATKEQADAEVGVRNAPERNDTHEYTSVEVPD